ncbi:hypothetical protein LAh9_74 [Aeromonas phage LAh_9]|uniref:Uncharacterized protein n=2 Tax=Lahexavirus TaxID=2843411 RepID=A0A514A153_9CAUD|nr:hypothetical protein HWC29_gp035 [Aeromonas phage 4_4572]YP_009847555.1 hypothetical protein HWC32_gp074 [Aeromonas phage LAh_9]QDH47001.1 hypothetical protein LAh9_74 [Aeromonas phage LAh_9]QEG09151.1 hypothetical protein [Aeromonas phage 4_4572]
MSFILGVVVGLGLAYAGLVYAMNTGRVFKLNGVDCNINVL